MKKQALLLIVIISSGHISAHAGYAQISAQEKTAQFFKSFVETVQNNKTVFTQAAAASTFLAILAYITYKFYSNGGYANNPGYDWAAEKEDVPDFMEYGTTFPTTVAPEKREETKPEEPGAIASPEQTAIDQQDAYWENFSERQMEILS